MIKCWITFLPFYFKYLLGGILWVRLQNSFLTRYDGITLCQCTNCLSNYILFLPCVITLITCMFFWFTKDSFKSTSWEVLFYQNPEILILFLYDMVYPKLSMFLWPRYSHPYIIFTVKLCHFMIFPIFIQKYLLGGTFWIQTR